MNFDMIMNEVVRRQGEAIRKGECPSRAMLDYLNAVNDGLSAATTVAPLPNPHMSGFSAGGEARKE